MIYYSLSQLKSLTATILFAVVFVFVVFIFKVIFVYSFNNKVFKNIQIFVYTILGGTMFLVSTNLYCFGEYNIILLAIYLFIFFKLSRSLNKLLDFLSLKVYYIYITIIKLEKCRIARKFGSIKD